LVKKELNVRRYVAFIHAGKKMSWGLHFPDFPGCVTAESDLDRLVDSAAEALRFHVEGMSEDGEKIPEPRSLSEIRADPAFADEIHDAMAVLIPLLPARGRVVRVNVSLDEGTLTAIDQAAEARGMTRSAFVAEAARRAIETDAA
jgi:predicted RNase H-like HicB family nuclease